VGAGAGIYSQGLTSGPDGKTIGYLEINDSQIYSNLAASNGTAGGSGAGISTNGGTALIRRTLIRNNPIFVPPDGSIVRRHRAALGGGIFSVGDLTIENSAIVDNYAIIDGGGIFHLLGDLTITNTTISGNTAERSGGGLFYHQGPVGNIDPTVENQKIRLTNVTIVNNSAFGFDSGIREDGVITPQPNYAGANIIGGPDIALNGQNSGNQNQLSITNSIINECLVHPNASIKSFGVGVQYSNATN